MTISLTNSPISLPNSPISLWEPSIFLPSSSISLQSPQELASCKNTLKVKTLLAKKSEVNEMRNRMREKGVNACLNSFISLKKPKNKLPKASSRAQALGSIFNGGSVQGAFAPWTLLERSLQNQGAQILRRNRTQEHAP
jgi:hypothetical protein